MAIEISRLPSLFVLTCLSLALLAADTLRPLLFMVGFN